MAAGQRGTSMGTSLIWGSWLLNRIAIFERLSTARNVSPFHECNQGEVQLAMPGDHHEDS
jgi:hypothetical protein